MLSLSELDDPYAFDSNKSGGNYGPEDPQRDH